MRFLVLALLGVMTGCGKSPSATIDEYRPEIEKLEAKLFQLKDKIPIKAEAIQADLKPKLILDEESPNHNCETVMYASLQGNKPLIDLMLTSNLSTSLYWAKQAPSGGNVEFMTRVMSGATKARYLVVHRIDESQLPVAVSDSEFVGGPVRVDGFVFDLESMTIVAAYVVEAIPADQVEYHVKTNESAKDRLQAFAQSSVWTNARERIAEAIRVSTGGEVVFR